MINKKINVFKGIKQILGVNEKITLNSELLTFN
jgi:hypothetical protein